MGANFKIVSLDPNLTEIIFALKLDNNLMGTVSHSNFPKEAQKIEVIGNYNNPKIEKLLILKPTHILAMEQGRVNLKNKLKRVKAKLISFQANSINDYAKMINKLGKLFNRSKEAQELILNWNLELNTFKKYSLNKNIAIAIQENPLIFASKSSFISEGLSKCGLNNLIDTKQSWPQITRERLLQLKPDIIIYLSSHSESNSAFKWYEKFGKVIQYSNDAIYRLSPRFLQSNIELCDKIQNNL